MNARLRTSSTTAIRVTSPWRGAQVDHRRDQLRRQVVDDEPAEVLEALGAVQRPAPDSPVTMTTRAAARSAVQRGSWRRRCARRRVTVASHRSDLGGVAGVGERCRARRARPAGVVGRRLAAGAAVGDRRCTASAVRRPMPGTAASSSTRGRAQPLHRAEMPHQRLAPRLAEPGDVVQRGHRHRLRPLLPVVGDGEPVRLVAHPLQQVQRLAGARQDHRVVLAGQPDLLQPLGQPADGDVVDAQLGRATGWPRRPAARRRRPPAACGG